jgi:hypothetical protein
MKQRRKDALSDDELKAKYCAGKASTAEMRRYFKSIGLSKTESDFRIDIERDRYNEAEGPICG